jgi:hypothetical protein
MGRLDQLGDADFTAPWKHDVKAIRRRHCRRCKWRWMAGSLPARWPDEPVIWGVSGERIFDMRARIIALALIGAVSLAVFGGIAVAQQDRYALKLGLLSFDDFKGYENWRVVAVSQTKTQLKVILANDVMMDAYRQGLPADGKLFPEGSKVVKIEWSMKKNTRAPYSVEVPDALQAVATIEKDSKRFPDTHGWAYGNFNYSAASNTFTPEGTDAKCGYACHTRMASQDYIYTAYPFR